MYHILKYQNHIRHFIISDRTFNEGYKLLKGSIYQNKIHGYPDVELKFTFGTIQEAQIKLNEIRGVK